MNFAKTHRFVSYTHKRTGIFHGLIQYDDLKILYIYELLNTNEKYSTNLQ